MSLYLKSGFWQLYDLDVYATGRLAWDRDANLTDVNRAWIAKNFSDDPATIATIEDIFAQSREVAKQGLYVTPTPSSRYWRWDWNHRRCCGSSSGTSSAVTVLHSVPCTTPRAGGWRRRSPRPTVHRRRPCRCWNKRDRPILRPGATRPCATS